MNMISEETARESLDQFLDYYEIDPDLLPEGVSDAIVSSLKKIEKAIQAGRLEIEVTDETIVIRQHLAKPPAGAPNPIVYKEVTGRAKVGIKSDSTDYGKMYAFLGALSGDGLSVIQSLKGKDLSLAESLGCVFLQV